MKFWSGILLLILLAPSLAAAQDSGQSLPSDLNEQVDAIILTAYKSASAEFPCKLKTRGKPKMLRWQDVDRCLNAANDRVDWQDIYRRVQALRKTRRLTALDITAAVESAMAAHAIPFDKIFSVKERKALLPLSNSLLKFLPSDSLQDLPVFTKKGKKIGTFSGVYTFSKRGGLTSANNFRLSIFQYTDLKGNMQAPAAANRLLLDRYGVPWKDAMTQPGFRLPTDELLPGY